MLIKLLAPGFLLLAIFAQYAVDYVWHDKRTQLHRAARLVLLILQIVAGIGTIATVVLEHKSSQEDRKALQRIREEAKSNAEASVTRDTERNKQLIALQKQVGELNGRLDPFIQIATRKYPGLTEASALERLTADLADVRSRTSRLERRIYSVSAAVELVLEGEWAERLSVGPEMVIGMPDDPYVRFIRSGEDRGKDIACLPTAISRRRQGNNRLIVNFEASVRPGKWPLGRTVDELREYRRAEFAVAMVERGIAKSKTVTLKEFRLKVFINGVPEVSRDDRPNYIVEIPDKGIRVLTLSGVDLLAEASKMAR